MSIAASQTKHLQLVQSIEEVRRHVSAARSRGDRIGLVPTMGALHDGHFSLIRAARDQSDFVIVTIFVNPTQFGPHEDFGKYPRSLERDVEACRDLGADLVFCPEASSIYPEGFDTFVEVGRLSQVLEGHFRPGHFRGVATVVLKLFNITTPDIAYFGQKDYQQQLLIRKMCRDLNLAVDVRICPTVREADGLALSSRNVYLNPEQRRSALALSRSLELARERILGGASDLEAVQNAMLDCLNAAPGVQVEYAVLADPKTLEELKQPRPEIVALVAARVGGTRLIDNLLIRP